MELETKRTNFFYLLYDKQAKGFITWIEKHEIAVLMFTHGELAEKYHTTVYPRRPISVYRLSSRNVRDFVRSMLHAKIRYALIDVPPQHMDAMNEHSDEEVRNYSIVDLKKVADRFIL